MPTPSSKGALMVASPIIWHAAISSGFVMSFEWVAWADRQITARDNVPMWVLDLSLAHTPKAALAVLGLELA